MIKFAGNRAEKPNMDNRNGQSDMTHPFSANLFSRYLYTAPVANNSSVTDTFILTAVTLIVLHRPENLFTEKTVFFRFVRAVVDRLRLESLAVRSSQDVFRRH
jgi:hypothetical protein